MDLNRSRLESPEFMAKLIGAIAKNVEEFLDDPRWSTDPRWRPGDASRSVYADTKTVVNAIKEKKKLDNLSLPADVSITIQNTCHSDFGLTIDESYKILSIYFSEI